MKYNFTIFVFIICAGLNASGNLKEARFLNGYSGSYPDSIQPVPLNSHNTKASRQNSYAINNISIFTVKDMLKSRAPLQAFLGTSKLGRPIRAYYFPGASNKRALVVAGVHGSELSSIEVAKSLIASLQQDATTFYSVIVVPCLFPDNEVSAKQDINGLGIIHNNGRYSNTTSADPNRQMPVLGKSFNINNPVDYLGRDIETENQLLLQLIEDYRPDRIVNLHAIRDVKRAGIYADPRTDSKGFALGYETDSALVIDMATYINNNGGYVGGNRLDSVPTALYYNDPAVVSKNEWQRRNLEGAKLPGNRGHGVSLGSWASTAVCDSLNPSQNRPALRLVTVEFPGYKRPLDYTEEKQKEYNNKLVDLYSTCIRNIFLASNYVEDNFTDPCDCKTKNQNDFFLTAE
jgi:hypothetical protein